jgi:hypothetical protein
VTVPGRSNNQCSKRWINTLDPIIKHAMGKWKPEEDAKLNEAVKEHGVNNWDAVAALVPGRTHGQCRYRWVASLDPSLNRGRWTAEEDANLTEAVTQLGNDWVRIAALVPGRTNIQFTWAPDHCNTPSKSTYSIDINGRTNKAAVRCGIKRKAAPETAATPITVVKISSSTETA